MTDTPSPTPWPVTNALAGELDAAARRAEVLEPPAAVDQPPDGGDAPDTLEDRLTDLADLIDAIGFEVDDQRRLEHRLVVGVLLARFTDDVLGRVRELLDRLADA